MPKRHRGDSTRKSLCCAGLEGDPQLSLDNSGGCCCKSRPPDVFSEAVEWISSQVVVLLFSTRFLSDAVRASKSRPCGRGEQGDIPGISFGIVAVAQRILRIKIVPGTCWVTERNKVRFSWRGGRFGAFLACCFRRERDGDSNYLSGVANGLAAAIGSAGG